MSHRQLTARWLLAAFSVLLDSPVQLTGDYRQQFHELWKMMRALGVYGLNELRDVAKGLA